MSQAFGLFGIRPEEFWDLTPREYDNLLHGYRMRSDSEWQRTAQLAAWLLQGQGNKNVTADKLLGKGQQVRETGKVNPDDKRRTLDELEDTLGKAGD